MPDKRKKLTPNQKRFAELYVGGPDDVAGNATEAYHQAYPDCSRESAASGAWRLLENPKVQARIRHLRSEAAKKAKLRARKWWELVPDAQATVQRIAEGAFHDPDAARVQLQAAKEVLDRALGSVRQMHQVEHKHSDVVVRVAGAAHAPQVEGENRTERGTERGAGRTISAESYEESYERAEAMLPEGTDQEEEGADGLDAVQDAIGEAVGG